jgi:hypothetical protein
VKYGWSAPSNWCAMHFFGKLSSLLTVKTLTGMTTDVYPRENCIAPAIVFIVWTTDTKNGWD